MTPDQLQATVPDVDRIDAPDEAALPAQTRRTPVGLTELVRAHGVRGLLYALAAVPLLSMIVEVARAPRLQFYDYWFVLARVANLDGSLNLRGVLTYRNEHPTFIPGLIYWLDARLLDGSNPPLGMLSIILAATTVVLLVTMLPQTVGGVTRAALAVVFAFLLLSPQGLHNFVMGMSGTGWLLANAAAAAAMVAVRRDRALLAVGFALVGSLSYGTAFALWPALAVAHWLRGDRRWKVALPLAIGVLIIVVWALTLDSLNPGPETGETGLENVVAGFAGTAGSLWGGMATIAGLTTITVLLTFMTLAARRRLGARTSTGPATLTLADAAPWIGLAVYALGGIAMIALARSSEGLDALLTSRYASMPALALCALLGLGVMYLPRLRPSLVVPLLLSVAMITYALSASRAANVRDNFPKQSAIAVAMHVGAVHAIVPQEFPLESVEVARNMRAYPFTDDFTLGCGGPELGDRVDLAGATLLPPAPGSHGYRGTIDLARNVIGDDGNPTGWYFSGWGLMDNRRPDCVMVVNSDGVVVGGGAVGVRRRDVVSELVVDEALSGFTAVAAPNVENPIVLLSSGGTLYRLDRAAD